MVGNFDSHSAHMNAPDLSHTTHRRGNTKSRNESLASEITLERLMCYLGRQVLDHMGLKLNYICRCILPITFSALVPSQEASKSPMFKAVFFDLYNTLAKFDPAREYLQQQVCAEYGIQVTHDGITKGYVAADDFMARENGKHHLAKRTEEARKEFFAEYEHLILLGAGVDVPAPLAGDIFQKIQTIPYHLALYDDAIPCIQALKSRGAIVGMITNIYADLHRTCARLGLTDCLDFWVTSKEAGSEKPHPAIFEMALSKAGVPAADTVHVGDQYYSDVTGARGVGITPVLIDRAGLSNNMDCTVIQGLSEVPDILHSTPAP